MSYDWRMNPYKCLACETRLQDCRCCDTGAPTLPFVVVIEGCGTFQGRYEFDATRYRDPDTLPAGVTYPATDPCGVFWGTLSAGEGCTAGGSTWSGSLGLLSWCDGTDAAIPWHVEIYCFDDDADEYVSQGEATVTSYECRCDGPRFAFTLPTLDCCCDGTTGPPCGECVDALPGTLVATCGSNSVTLTWNGTTAWVGTSSSFCGVTNATITLTIASVDPSCTFDLNITGDCSPVSQAGNTGPISCNPLLISFSSGYQDCDGVDKTVTITE